MIELKSCPKKYTLDQDKVTDPSSTIENALKHLETMLDLSSFRIEPRKDAIEGAYSFSSISDKLKTSGKGLTPEQSKASAVMEFAERYSWLHFDYEHYEGYCLKSFNEIKKGDIQTVDESYFLCNFIDLKDRDELLREIKDIPLKWVLGTCLNDRKPFYYPVNWHNMVVGSNGLAAGNTMEEAILQALCEVIERENICRLFMDMEPGNDLKLESINNLLVTRVLENSQKNGIKFTIKDISFDFKVPTFIAYGIREQDKDKLTYQGVGQGASTDPQKALIRALAEYFEGFSLMCVSQEELNVNWKEVMSALPKKHTGFLPLYNTEMLLKSKKSVTMDEVPSACKPDIKEEILYIMGILEKSGYKTVVIDKTHLKLDIPAVRVCVPGMRVMINMEIKEPRYAISEVYHEAGDSAASIRHFAETVKNNPVTKDYYNVFASIPGSDLIYKKDYIELASSVSDLKKDAVGMVNNLLKIQGLDKFRRTV
ncbi:MAG: YcaO-like family protein [Candidatus Saganbacteria bacterium]|nr:YcaO-like family protein [Candidatus Saganbacteria bacterium]